MRADAVDWTRTEAGTTKYREARATAQAGANRYGYDYGIERFDGTQSFHVFMLPNRDVRQGHELRCEVVMCEVLNRCAPGHGPVIR